MKKSLIDKRVNTFKNAFPNFKTSNKGNFYAEIGKPFSVDKTIHFNGINVTKGLLNKIGTERTYTKTYHPIILLITPSGKLMVKMAKNYTNPSNMTFKNVTIKDINNIHMRSGVKIVDRRKIVDIFFIGRKFEYLKDLDYMWGYRCMQNFNSFREFKNHIGYDFISSDTLKDIFMKYGGETDILTPLLTTDNKANLISLLSKGNVLKTLLLLNDTLSMAKDLQLPFHTPKGLTKLEKIHDGFVLIQNQSRIDSYSDENVYNVIPSFDFVKWWEEKGLVVKPLDTPRKLYLQGLKQKHCIGSYYNSLDNYVFYTIDFDGIEYDIMFSPSGKINQFYGKFNCTPPPELERIVRDSSLNYKLSIKLKEGANLIDYPNIKTNNLSSVETEIGW